MNIKSLLASTKTYVVILIMAVALLLYTAGVGYKQVKRLHESGELVSKSLDLQRTIVELSAKFSLLETIQLKAALDVENTNLNAVVITEIDQSLERLKDLTSQDNPQQKRVAILIKLRNELVEEIKKDVGKDINDSTNINTLNSTSLRFERISRIVDQAKEVRESMLSQENYLMVSRREEYTSQSFLTPLSSLLVALVSLGIFLIGFFSIYKQKGEITEINNRIFEQNKKLQETESFLRGVYQSSNNVISHFKPVKDQTGNVVDFKFEYTSTAIEAVTGSNQDTIIGKSLLTTYPAVLENGLFSLMVACYLNGETQEHESLYVFEEDEKYICNTVVKSGSGITNTAWDTTKVKEAEKVLQQLNEELSLQNTIFKEAENVAGIGSFIWYLDDGSATISDNFYRILGYDPNSFPVSFQSYREFVHPEDLASYDLIGEETTEKGVSSMGNYRIITKNKEIKHLSITGRYIEIDNRPVSVGIAQDITERVKKDSELLDSYEKLKQSNEELESFNRVASHDLQEPLRKIQMFISRMGDGESQKLSEKSKAYFEKITIAADRMQKLIQNLLSYSGLERHTADKEEVDLAQVMDKVKEELSQRIKETNTIINYGTLPKVEGVTFKLEQVFVNLIGNSIKYRKKEESPVITIQSEKVHKNQIVKEFQKNSTYYHRISFVDNGIGFAPEYATTIFEVFQRLHSKTDYSGTGIGLSICKKIVEKHNGYIYALGDKGKGSTFIVYLPADL